MFFPPHFKYLELSNLLIYHLLEHRVSGNNIFKYIKSTIQNMTNFGHVANFGGKKLSNCNFGDTNISSYDYFIIPDMVGIFCCEIKVHGIADNYLSGTQLPYNATTHIRHQLKMKCRICELRQRLGS
jgi:hypothetical protein